MTWNVRFRIAPLVLSLGLAGCAAIQPTQFRARLTVSMPILDTGTLGDAPYRVEIPRNWNGELVMLLHGYEPKGVPRQTPWPQNEATSVFLAQGYAVAASAYTSQGWSVGEALPDNEKLRSYFAGRFGKPHHTYLVGFSLGGQIALASLEQYGREYSGALSLCGVNLTSKFAFEEAVVTSLVAFDYLFPGGLGLASGGLADPTSPPMLDIEAVEAALKADERGAAILSKRLDIPRAGLAGALMLNYMVLQEMQTRAGGFPVDNSATVYAGFGDDAAFNRGVRRYIGDRKAMQYLRSHGELTGRIKKPLVIQSNIDDPTVPGRFNGVYPMLVRSAGSSTQLSVLPPLGNGHCSFSPGQIQTAFGTLTRWVKSGVRPSEG